MSVLSDPSIFKHCPPVLASKIDELHNERRLSGIETTPDETSDVIESLFEHLGRLWMAELWHAIENQTLTIRDCDGILLTIIEQMQGRSLTTGSWVYFSRQISDLFKQNNLSSVVQGLDTVNWGQPGDNGLIARIMEFRNRFAHGSFEAPIDVINAGYNDVDTLIQQVPGLWKQRWSVLTTIGWQTITTDGLITRNLTSGNNRFSEQNGVEVMIENGESFMSLTPFFAHLNDGSTIILPMWKPITITEGLQQEQITVWHQKYRKEYAGLITRNDIIQQRRSFTSAHEDTYKSIVTQLCNTKHETTMLIGHPGTGLTSILPSLLKHSQQDPTDTQWFFWDVKPFDLTQSASCLVKALGETLQKGIFTDENGNPIRKFKDLSEQLECVRPLLNNRNLMIAIDGLQYGNHSYRFEEHTIIDVCNWLTEMNASLVLIHHPTENRTPIFFSSQIHWPIYEIIDIADFKSTYKWLNVETTPLYKNLLNTLQTQPNSSLFDICDALDAANPQDPAVFEPEIEYALWHLRPLLKTQIQSVKSDTQKQDSIRTWSTFSNEAIQ